MNFLFFHLIFHLISPLPCASDGSANLFAVSFNSLSRQIRQRMKRDSEFSYGDFGKVLLVTFYSRLDRSVTVTM